MVRKLLGYELKYYAKYLTPAYILFICAAVAIKGLMIAAEIIVKVFELPDYAVGTILSLSPVIVFAWAICLSALLIANVVMSVARYYKNLYSTEGYLTLSLPVSATQHVVVKLLGDLISKTVTLIVGLGGGILLLSGELLVEITKAGVYIVGNSEPMALLLFVLMILSAIPMALVSSLAGTLFYYTCISIGQRASKNRVLISVLTFFGFMAANYVISMVLAAALTLGSAVFGGILAASGVGFDSLYEIMETVLVIFPIATYVIGTVFYGAAAVVMFFISRNTLKNKLNLE